MLIYGLLGLVPVVASFLLGLMYFWLREDRTTTKTVGAAVFVVAAYLQFASPYALAGMLLQIVLAISLELWRRARTIP